IIESHSPCIALTAHTGNWELMAAYFASLGIRVVTIGRVTRNRFAHRLVSTLREHYGVHTVWRSGLQGHREIVKILKSGGTIAALIDQDTHVSSVNSTFFGNFARTPSSLIELGLRHNASFVTAFNFRQPNNTFLVRVEELHERTVEGLVNSYNSRLEEYIRQFPGQWVWFHKRWRSLPSGERLSSSAYEEWLQQATESLSLVTEEASS
ncbi:MAG: lysophospholipid acyltransferase family protein, partial [Bdellovibrionales bacterium]|nr:lysophospholipid acyltransferase family protein [Bdellovibrionales bacterium]